MNTTTIAAPSTKKFIKSIVITRREGLTSECLSSTHTSWSDAEKRIASICTTSPVDGGYNKTDFVITWNDDETYEGRYDAIHSDSPAHEGTLKKHCLDHLTFGAGLRRPDWMTEIQYEEQIQRNPDRVKESTAFLKKYSFEDAPQPERVITPEQVYTAAAPDGPTVPDGASAGESATIHRTYCTANKVSLMPVLGNSFPVKGVLYAWGGKWDGASKQWLVPAYKHAEAQTLVDGFTNGAKPKAAPVVVAPAPVVRPVPVRVVQPIVTKPAKVKSKSTFRTPLQKRFDALLAGMVLLAQDLPPGMITDAIIYLEDRKDRV